MNIPFLFDLTTSAKIYGRLFEPLAVAATYDFNQILNGFENANAAFGATVADVYGNAGVPYAFVTTPRALYVTSISLAAWYSADIGTEVDFGLFSTAAGTFLPLYPCVATGTNAGGMVHSGHVYETGFRVNWTSVLLPCFRAKKQTATDGSVRIAGHISVITESL